VPSLPALTSPTAVFRLHGRNFQGHLKQLQGKQPTVSEKYHYLYSEKELEEIARTASALSGRADRVHTAMNNNNRPHPKQAILFRGPSDDGTGTHARRSARSEVLIACTAASNIAFSRRRWSGSWRRALCSSSCKSVAPASSAPQPLPLWFSSFSRSSRRTPASMAPPRRFRNRASDRRLHPFRHSYEERERVLAVKALETILGHAVAPFSRRARR
jgi:Protein of unknown function DUF72